MMRGLQGAAVQSKAVQWSCDVTEITKLAEELETDSVTLASDIVDDVNDIINNTEACVESFLSSLDINALVTCVTDEVQSAITEITTTVEDYVNNVESVANQIAQQVIDCVNV